MKLNPRGLELGNEAYLWRLLKKVVGSNLFEADIHINKSKYPMWNDLRTYFTSISPQEKNALFNAISYFKKKETKQ
jgi:hypothetical protein